MNPRQDTTWAALLEKHISSSTHQGKFFGLIVATGKDKQKISQRMFITTERDFSVIKTRVVMRQTRSLGGVPGIK